MTLLVERASMSAVNETEQCAEWKLLVVIAQGQLTLTAEHGGADVVLAVPVPFRSVR